MATSQILIYSGKNLTAAEFLTAKVEIELLKYWTVTIQYYGDFTVLLSNSCLKFS